jgi:hypothetical protein
MSIGALDEGALDERCIDVCRLCWVRGVATKDAHVQRRLGGHSLEPAAILPTQLSVWQK